MKLTILTFADYAAENTRGKFTLVGAGFNEINVRQFPTIHPLMFIFVRLQIEISDTGRNRIEVRLVGEKGVAFKAECDLDVKDAHQGEERYANMPLPLHNSKFDEPGEYRCEVRVNGIELGHHSLRIKAIEPQPTA